MAIAVRDLRVVLPERSGEESRDFDDFYRAYARRVRGLVRRRISDRELAAEVVQDTFLRAHTNFDRLDTTRSAWPWLATVASNLCVDALRRNARQSEALYNDDDALGTDECVVDSLDWDSDPAEAFEQSLRAEAVRCALATVPARQRQVLLLKDDEGWTAEQIAHLDGVSPEGIKSLVRRARVTFRESYERVAEEKGLRAGFAVLGAPLARLRARLSHAVATRTPLFGSPFLGLPLDMSQVVGAAVLSGFMFAGVVPVPTVVMSPISASSAVPVEAPAVAPSAPEAEESSGSGAVRTGVSVAAPSGTPAASVATLGLVEDGEARTLEVIIAGKAGLGGTEGTTWSTFDCDHSQARSAACDTAEQLPGLPGE
jgi:RNA polymerase sigma-70 factor (ECF subfamily)